MRAVMVCGRRLAPAFERPVRPRRPWRSLVIQLGGIGDVLRVFPLIERLHDDHPGATVALLTNQSAELLELYGGARRPRHVQLDLRWSYARKLRLLARLRREGFDLVVNPSRGDGMLECAVMAWLIGAPHRLGFEHDGAGFLHTWRRPLSGEVSLLEQNLALLAPLGIAAGEARQRLSIPAAARACADEWYARHASPGALRVVVHPWASSHSRFRAWPFAKYAALVEAIVREREAAVLVLGTAQEAGHDRPALAALRSPPVHDLSGTTSLVQAAALIAGADLFVGNDSSLLHMALSADVPAVAIFGATPPAQLLPPAHRALAVRGAGLPCQPCYRHQPLFAYRCPNAFRCLVDLEVAKVLQEVRRVAPPQAPLAAARPR